jgi:integrase
MISIQQHQAFHGRNCYSTPFHDLNIPSQLRVLLDAVGREHLHRAKVVSTKTCNERSLLASLVFRQLAEGDFKPRSVLSFSQAHITYLVKRWESEKLSPATMQTRFSHLRWFAAAIGKPGLVRAPSFYGLDDACYSRNLLAVRDKSWSAKEVDIDDIVRKVEQIDRLVALHVRLMHEFGLRLREAILLRPLIAHLGEYLRVEEGTKGGRTRVVPIRYESQLEVLRIATEVSRSLPKGRLVPAGSNFDTARNRFYYVMKQCGITKAQLGVTGHGLRHEYANDLYEEISGQKSVVRGASEILDRARDKDARRQVTNDLGHVRLDVTAAYTGPMNPKRVRIQRPPPQQAQSS